MRVFEWVTSILLSLIRPGMRVSGALSGYLHRKGTPRSDLAKEDTDTQDTMLA